MSVGISVCSLTIIFVTSPFPLIFTSVGISVCSLTMLFPIFPFPYIKYASFRIIECPLTLLFPILPFSNLFSIIPCHCSLTMIFPILPFPYIYTFTYVTSYKKNSYKNLSLTLFEKIPLKQLLENKHYMIHIHENAIQLNLFNNLTGH